jgi:uncharacterized protein (DUF342 family)
MSAPWWCPVGGEECRRLVGVGVGAVAQSFTGDLAQPGVVVAGTVDAVTVELIGEICIDVGVCGSGETNCRTEH